MSSNRSEYAFERAMTLLKLEREFKMSGIPISRLIDLQYKCIANSCITMGAEVEIMWRSYFPNLAPLLQGTTYAELPPTVAKQLDTGCALIEATLLPQLNLTTQYGIPRGTDRYWEFAHRPVYHPSLLIHEIMLLKRAGLIPKDREHALHITLGGISSNVDSGIVLTLLELFGYSTPERICGSADSGKVFGWSKKGRGGIRPRTVDKLSLGAVKGIEYRTLQLPIDDADMIDMFEFAWGLSEISIRPEFRHMWNVIKVQAYDLFRPFGVDLTTNWGRPFESPDPWLQYQSALQHIKPAQFKLNVKNTFRYLAENYVEFTPTPMLYDM